MHTGGLDPVPIWPLIESHVQVGWAWRVGGTKPSNSGGQGAKSNRGSKFSADNMKTSDWMRKTSSGNAAS